MIHSTSHRLASPVVSHRVLDSAFASAFSCHVSPRRGSRSTPLRSAKSRRRGQALLIAVLLMIFAAVLGATFVTVVALNLNQTARSGSINTARVAADAGQDYVNEQLTNSPLGERWRPEINAQTPAAAGDTYYFTDYERAQGWDQADANGARFIKFPDPRSPAITGNNTPTYLTKVEPVIAPLITDPDHERDGQLKITIIGRSPDNDAASFPLVFYKSTSQNGGMFSFARYDSNWNFRTNSLLTTRVLDAVTTPNTVITLANARGFAPGRTILIGAADTPTTTQARIIRRVGPDDPTALIPPVPFLQNNQVELDQPVTVAANEPVRAASPYVGGLPDIDALGAESGVPTLQQATATPYEYEDVLLAPPPLSPEFVSGGLMINNGILFQGKSQFVLNTTAPRPDRVLVAGLISIGGAATIANVRNSAATEDIKNTSALKPFVRYQQSESTDPTDRTQVVKPLTPARLDLPNSRWLLKTKLTGDEGAFYGYGEGVYIDNKEDLETVQENKPNVAGDAVITTFRRQTLSETQRLLTRKSLSATPNSAPSFKINHTLPSGIVKVETYDPAPGNTDLQPELPTFAGYRNASALVVPPNTPPSVNPNTFNRLSFPRLGVDNYNFPIVDVYPDQPFVRIGSLEQRGVRGWISPFEFLPRGALIELRGTDIVITRDDLSDASEKQLADPTDTANTTGYVDNPKYNHPDENKAWKGPNGSLLTNDTVLTAGNPGARTYRMRIDIATGQRFLGAPGNEVAITPLLGGNKPFNGVIYADGNVRVRGHLDKDVTIVSMGTIYIEGGINKIGGHVALLAKRNAVLNPTQFAARPAGLQIGNPPGSPGASFVPDTRLSDAVTPNGTPFTSITNPINLPVGETSGFRIGDRVRIGTSPETWLVTKISATLGVGTISLANPSNATLTAAYNDIVSSLDDAPLSRGANKLAYTVGNYSRDLLRDGATNAGIYQLSIVHAGQLRPGAQMTLQADTDPTVNIKKETTVDGIIKQIDTEKQIAAGTVTPIELTTAPPNTFTLKDLQDRFFAPVGPDPDPRWDFTLFGAVPTTSAHRLAAVSTTAILPATPRPMLLTTSIGGYWQNSATPNFVIGSGFLPQDDEDARTVQESFYGVYTAATNTFAQANFQGVTYQLNSAPLPNGDNLISLRRAVVPTETLANDLVVGIKYDRDTLANVAAAPVDVKVEATIYAQDGSWFVIAMPAMTPRPANPLTPTTNEIAQANGYRRLNYQIKVKANIAENFAPTGMFDYDTEQTPDQTPTVTPVVGLGAQAQWLDSSSYPTAALPLGSTWQTINYLAPDPLPFNNTLYLPVTPDIINQR